MTPDRAEEFDCLECGRHIVRIIADPNLPNLCAACITMPGWFRIPAIREVIDPDVKPPPHELEAGDLPDITPKFGP